mgnify:CR=1 FL=1
MESSDSFGVSNRLALIEPMEPMEPMESMEPTDASSLFFNDTHPTQSIVPREPVCSAPVDSISLFPLCTMIM